MNQHEDHLLNYNLYREINISHMYILIYQILIIFNKQITIQLEINTYQLCNQHNNHNQITQASSLQRINLERRKKLILNVGIIPIVFVIKPIITIIIIVI